MLKADLVYKQECGVGEGKEENHGAKPLVV